MAHDASCIFCRILSGQLPASVVLADTLVVAFLDISPINVGHTLVVPRRHTASYVDLIAEEIAALGSASQRVMRALRACLPTCAGVTLSLADGEVAGQEVMHAHMHVIPRFAGDKFGWRRFGARADRTALDELAGQLTRRLE